MMMAAAILCAIHTHAQTIQVNSPAGRLHATIRADETHRLSWSLQLNHHPLVLPCPLGITIGAIDLGQDVVLGPIHQTVIDHYRQTLISVTQTKTGIHYLLACRSYDNGFAYRYIVPASSATLAATRRATTSATAAKDSTLVTGEASAWRLPPASRVWYQENVYYYEGLHYDTPIAALGTKQLGPPVTYQTPDGDYASITEAALYNYSGMSLRSDSSGTLHAAFVNDPKGWKIPGTVTSPWRVILAAGNLNDLVNTNLIADLNPAPDSAAAHARWIKPGRAVWSYFRHDNVTTVDLEKYYIDNAARLGFEYSIVDAGWDSSWPNALDSLRSLVAYAKQRHIRLFVWKSYASLKDDATRKAFFKQMQQVGLAGLKIDYIDKEGIDQVRFYEQALRDALATHLMIDFHGANKPTGLGRRFPNEITREGIYGQEWRTYTPQGPVNNAIIPFTRFLAGPGDYTPGVFTSSLAYGTSRTQQLALPVIYNSPLLCWADDPAAYLASPAANIIRSIPTTWDETRVLAPSRIGELVAFARRKGNDWFIAVIDAGEERQLDIPLDFLQNTAYRAEILTDDLTNPDSLLHAITAYTAADTLSIRLRPKGGFVARLTPAENPIALKITPAGGYWQGPTRINIVSKPHIPIRYTTDGSEPTNRSTLYTIPLTLSAPSLIKARVFTGERPDPAAAVAQFPAAPAPIASPAGGIFTTNGSIALSTNQKAPIRYTTDGSEPTAQSPLYHDPIAITNTTTIKSRIFFSAGGTSSLGSTTYERVAPDLAVTPASNQGGLQYAYYEGKWDSMPDLTRLEAKKQGLTASPDLSALPTRANEYALQFHGFINVPDTGVYTFYTISDDGSQLYIGNEKVVDNDGCHGDLERSGDRALATGRHPFTLNYFQNSSGQTLQVFIKGPHMEKQLIPAKLFSY
jgi:Glycoside hydrolase 97/Glycosyl-hydrolase 97 N-terminal/Glycosyl-hydrolase 97 C-terminal, oligomerisation/Chitobiase/beta-hexosaminidase C-terminal domain/PA14 domain